MHKLWDFIKSGMLKYPDKTVKDEFKTYTYKALIGIAEESAIALTETKYAILCKSELNAAIGILSVIAAGKTAIPLSYRYGENHYKKILAEIKPNCIIKDEEITLYSGETDAYDTENLFDVAFIMCTSGTTGVPKGAMITDKNIMANISDISEYFGLKSSDKILISRPLYHCAVLTGEFLVSLVNGAAIHFGNEGFNPPRIIDYIAKNNITVFCNTPSGFYYICRLAKENMLSSLRKIAVSGECMTLKTAELMKEKFKAEIFNVYGLTEASPRVSCLSPELFIKSPLSVGKPLRSVSIKVVDNELWVKGGSIMKGHYRGKEVLKDGWLHTGDIAEIDEDGLLYIKSRKDDMIIKGGMNIYPQEIENALLKDERIKEVLVYGVRNEYGQKIAADIVTDTQLTKSDVLKICAKELTPYQTPDEINFVEALRKNASGKMLRNK